MSENLRKISFRIPPKRYNLIKEGLDYEFSYQTKASKFIRSAIDLLLFFDGQILFEEIYDEDLKGRIKLEKQTLPRLALNMERDRIEKEQLYEKILNTHNRTLEMSKEMSRFNTRLATHVMSTLNVIAALEKDESTEKEIAALQEGLFEVAREMSVRDFTLEPELLAEEKEDSQKGIAKKIYDLLGEEEMTEYREKRLIELTRKRILTDKQILPTYAYKIDRDKIILDKELEPIIRQLFLSLNELAEPIDLNQNKKKD